MDQQQPRSPRIVSIEWGRIEAEGLGTGKDLKLYPGGGREWDWAETGTRHSPGIQPADVEELLTHGANVVVLSRGMNQVLQVDPATLAYLEQRSVVVHVAETREAAEIYNKLAEDSPVKPTTANRQAIVRRTTPGAATTITVHIRNLVS
jgi:hypothetical protein